MTLDSSRVKQLRAFQARYEFLDSAYPSAVREIAKDDSIIAISDRQIDNLQQQNFKLQESVDMLKGETVPFKIPPLFVWQGFHVGLSAQYSFEDSILTKTTFLNGMVYALEGRAGVLVGERLILEGSFGIPLSKRKMYVKAFVGWRLF